MKMTIYFKITMFLILIFSCNNNEQKLIKIKLNAKNSSGVSGNISFIQKENKVYMEAHVFNLSPGEHAIHLHEKADCSSEDGTSTGGHWNPTCLLYTSPSPRDAHEARMPSSA